MGMDNGPGDLLGVQVLYYGNPKAACLFTIKFSPFTESFSTDMLASVKELQSTCLRYA